MDLQEYDRATGVALSQATVLALQRALPWSALTPSLAGPGLYDIKASSYVGVWEDAEFSLRVMPKVEASSLAYILGFSRESARRWGDGRFRFAPERGLSELLIPGFLDAAERAFVGGVAQGYRDVSERVPGIRGRIDFQDHIRRGFGMRMPVSVSYQEFTPDIVENRMIKAAALKLRRLDATRSHQHRQLRSIEALLSDVSDVGFHTLYVPDPVLNRLTARYADVLALSRVVLCNSRLDVDRGPVQSKSFFVNMNYAFEDFIVKRLRQELRASCETFVQACAGKKLPFDDQGKIGLRPDFTWWQAGRCAVIGDVKYMEPDIQEHQHALYQAEAYAIAAGLSTAFLIYGSGCPPRDIRACNSGITIKVRGLDLGRSSDELSEAISRLSDELRWDAALPRGIAGGGQVA